ncbi:hypothetical protein HHI36_016512 [Cryptolaemus montrouzieri]|uniref:Uncharacterized protein n=1 Tax=Cryptolaemus montrouzieri TaxID=559131 RepID=A0ABD2NKB6_9CUCU
MVSDISPMIQGGNRIAIAEHQNDISEHSLDFREQSSKPDKIEKQFNDSFDCVSTSDKKVSESSHGSNKAQSSVLSKF